MYTKLLSIVLAIAIIVVSGCSVNTGPPVIELSTSSFDFGDIDPGDGVRTEIFAIKNIGHSPLVIESVSTSCGCTEAEVNSSEILPGEETELIVNYDPSVHPGLVGKIKRIVYIKSSDPFHEEVELELVGNSLPADKKDDHDEEYEGLLEEFELSPHTLNEKLESGEDIKLLDVREDYEYEENHIKGTLLLSLGNITQEELDKLGLKKDDEIIVYCRSGKRSAEAYEILMDLGYKNVKSLYGGIVHWIEDGYSVEQDAQITQIVEQSKEEDAPVISFDRLEHDFGEIAQFGGVVNASFEITNRGDSDLKITSISTSCGCASAELEESIIPSGASTTLVAFFDPDFHEEPEGRFSRTIFLETNDPANPEAELKIWMDILEGE